MRSQDRDDCYNIVLTQDAGLTEVVKFVQVILRDWRLDRVLPRKAGQESSFASF